MRTHTDTHAHTDTQTNIIKLYVCSLLGIYIYIYIFVQSTVSVVCCVSVSLWPRFLWGGFAAYCSVCGYCPSVCVHDCIHTFIPSHCQVFFFFLNDCPHHIFRGDDKRRETSCLSKRESDFCLVFLLVQKSFKNTNDCIFMVGTLHIGLLCVLQKWFLWRPQSSSSQFGRKTFGSAGFVVPLRNTLLLDLEFFFFFARDSGPDIVSLTFLILH